MKTTTYLATLGCALLLGHSAVADDSTAEDMDQIVVTGARTPLTVNQVGSALTVITRDEIERREARHVIDLLRSVPGFAVSQTGVLGSQAQVRVRGAEANHILVLIDGVRANDPATGDEFR
ncbi:MAG: TonB-dependent receptor, partial [Proteobacteria bacterium]|nr:TonB-dependent receptor [Pseudomonadota bacterium]